MIVVDFIVSSKDEMVSRRSVEYLEDNPYISVKKLENSGHYYYDKDGKQEQIVIIKDGFQTFNPTEEMLLEEGWVEYIESTDRKSI